MYLFSAVFQLWCALAFQTALFEDVFVRLIAKMPIDFSLHFFLLVSQREQRCVFSSRGGQRKERASERFKICINRDLNLLPEINMCNGGKEKRLSGGNQKWSMKLMKQRCHRLIQLSFQFPWQSSVIVPTIFSAGKKRKRKYGGGGGCSCEIVPNFTRGSLASGSSVCSDLQENR